MLSKCDSNDIKQKVAFLNMPANLHGLQKGVKQIKNNNFGIKMKNNPKGTHQFVYPTQFLCKTSTTPSIFN